ncbi:MAG: hypothetical protein NVS3B26_25240 [Mycobacteriales bacterium]
MPEATGRGPRRDLPVLPPSIVAAQRAHMPDVARSGRKARAYPALATVDDQTAVSAQLSATRAMLSAVTPKQVADVVATLVHDLGGAVVPARVADPASSIDIDISFGLSEPLLPFAEPVSLGAMRLGTVLPDFMADARLVVRRLQGEGQRENEATRDVLTGLLTRRAWMRRLSQAEPGDAVCLIDLDRFKAVNDALGHAAGDEVLRAIGKLLNSSFRDLDACGRYGGDELACLASRLPAEALAARCDSLRRHWEQQRPAAGASVGLSIGVAAVGGRGGRAALDAADRAMYRVKTSGRNVTMAALAGDHEHFDAHDTVGPLAAYLRALEVVDTRAATDVVLALLDDGVPTCRITSDVLGPAQVRVGQMWESGQWSVADEHAATAVTETALSVLVHMGDARRGSDGPHVVFACVEGELHDLPARMAAAVAADSGARVTVLGAALPADQLRHRLQAGDVDVLALSCTMPTNLLGAAQCVAAAHQAHVPVLVGGGAFGAGPLRAYAIGADACAFDAADAFSRGVALAGRNCAIPNEVLLLDSIDDGTLSVAYERIVAEIPQLSTGTADQRTRIRADLRSMARFTGAAVLTGDPVIVDDLLTWLCRPYDDQLPAVVVTTSAQLLADTLAVTCPAGADVLRRAATRGVQSTEPTR